MTDEREILESIDRRLKMLLQLRLEEKMENCETKKEKVKLLHQSGFETKEIADIIGTSTGSVRGLRSSLRSEGVIDD